LQAWQQETVWQRLQQQSLEDIDDVELKVAIFSHSHWIERLKAHIVNGGEGEMPPQDERQCQLGRWYNGMGRSRYGNRPIYAFIPPKHNRVHELAESLLRWSKAGEQAKVEAGLEELQTVSVELIEMLRRLP
jgi:methyl-accepting chemotaxis protein